MTDNDFRVLVSSRGTLGFRSNMVETATAKWHRKPATGAREG